jgi:hypothetical protein
MSIDKGIVAPARERDVLLDGNLEPAGPHAAHRNVPHPGQALDARADLAQVGGEEVSRGARQRGFELRGGGAQHRAFQVHARERKVLRQQ